MNKPFIFAILAVCLLCVLAAVQARTISDNQDDFDRMIRKKIFRPRPIRRNTKELSDRINRKIKWLIIKNMLKEQPAVAQEEFDEEADHIRRKTHWILVNRILNKPEIQQQVQELTDNINRKITRLICYEPENAELSDNIKRKVRWYYC